MDLDQYKKIHRLTAREIAAALKVSMAMVSEIVHGRKPSWKVALAIEEYTNGAVPRETWYPASQGHRLMTTELLSLEESAYQFFRNIRNGLNDLLVPAQFKVDVSLTGPATVKDSLTSLHERIQFAMHSASERLAKEDGAFVTSGPPVSVSLN